MSEYMNIFADKSTNVLNKKNLYIIQISKYLLHSVPEKLHNDHHEGIEAGLPCEVEIVSGRVLRRIDMQDIKNNSWQKGF